jgi:hypothetical protein
MLVIGGKQNTVSVTASNSRFWNKPVFGSFSLNSGDNLSSEDGDWRFCIAYFAEDVPVTWLVTQCYPPDPTTSFMADQVLFTNQLQSDTASHATSCYDEHWSSAPEAW